MAVRPQPAVTFCTGKGTRSKRLPCTLRHSEMPGLPEWVRATSIHPSLLKSSTTAPTVGGSPASAKSGEDLNKPSRGLAKNVGAGPEPVTSRSTARSLLRSERVADTVVPSPPRPACSVQFVNVALPLLRHNALGFDPAADAWPVTKRSRSPSWS